MCEINGRPCTCERKDVCEGAGGADVRVEFYSPWSEKWIDQWACHECCDSLASDLRHEGFGLVVRSEKAVA